MIDDSVRVFFDKLYAIHLKIEPLCGNDELVNKNNLDFTICINNAGHRSDPFILSTRGRNVYFEIVQIEILCFRVESSYRSYLSPNFRLHRSVREDLFKGDIPTKSFANRLRSSYALVADFWKSTVVLGYRG